MRRNPLFAIDFYKVGHHQQYPKGTTEIYSNFTPRYVHRSAGIPEDFDKQVVVFGIQGFIREHLITDWNEYFFERDKDFVVDQYKDMVCTSLGLVDYDCSHIESLHDLGYLPIEIKAISEGFKVPIGVPILTIKNTHPDFFWLPNFLETIISASLWKPITSATTAFSFRKLFENYAEITGSDKSLVKFQGHDFSFRGMSGWEDAAKSGAAHLTSFMGTDCVSAIDYLETEYQADGIVGCSVPATEHSVMCADGKDSEFSTIERLITETYPTGIVSIVSDSYDFWRVLMEFLPTLKTKILERDGKLVIRPDSGDPLKIICGDVNASKNSPEARGALEILWDTFGGVINYKGYKELNSHIGLIYGDAITLDVANRILNQMEQLGFASSNIVFGIGSFTYQYVTRDTFGFAMKATSAVINGERRAIFKDPKTGDGSKRSARGLLAVEINFETCRYELHEDVSENLEDDSCLETVFKDGKLTKLVSIRQIRENIEEELILCL